MISFESAVFQDFTIELGRNAEIGLAVTLATMMFSVALGLRSRHFYFFKNSPHLFATGIVGQLLVLPFMTLVLCFVLAPPPAIALGMILVACCPGGNVSNLLVLLGKGDTALSVSLTAASSIVAAFFTPILIVFWSSQYLPTAELLTSIDFDTRRFLMQTVTILALPLIAGMLLARYAAGFAVLIRRPLVVLSVVGLITLTVLGIAKYWHLFWAIGVTVIGLVVLHNALAFLLGYLLARFVGADSAARRAITFEVGIQNSGLGIVILLTQMNGVGGAAVVVGLWGTWHVVAGLILVALFRNIPRI